MSSTVRRAAILTIVGAGALATAYVLLLRRRKRQSIDTVDNSTAQTEEAPSTLTASDSLSENTVNNSRTDTQVQQATNAKSKANRRKRRNPQVTFEDDNQPSTSTMAKIATPVQQPQTDTIEPCANKEELANFDWSSEVERVTAEMDQLHCSTEDTKNCSRQRLASPKGRKERAQMQSPSQYSHTSVDSGHGTATVATAHDNGAVNGASLSPSDEAQQAYDKLPAMYEFEIPQSLVGLVIGIKGQTVKEISTLSETTMVIRREHPSARPGYQICTVEGKRSNVNLCLQLLRRKFPLKRFPELNLKPVLPPTLAPSAPLVASTAMLSLPEGVPVEVAICNVQSPSHFFLNQPTHPTFTALSTLDDCIAQVYRQPTGVPQLVRPVGVGILCIAPMNSPPWTGWYRAVTCAYAPETDNVLIKYVDYGGYANVQADALRQIRSDFTTLPFQAVECYLAHVQPVPSNDGGNTSVDTMFASQWSQEAFDFFTNIATEKIIEATVVAYCRDDGKPMVELTTVVDNERRDVAQLLVDRGYATITDSPSGTPSDIQASPSP